MQFQSNIFDMRLYTNEAISVNDVPFRYYVSVIEIIYFSMVVLLSNVKLLIVIVIFYIIWYCFHSAIFLY